MKTAESIAAPVNDERDDLETMNNEETRSRCKAFTKKGEQCKNRPPVGSEYCRVHQEEAERPTQQAGTEPAPEEQEEKVKEQQQRSKKHEWDTRATFKVFFEKGIAEHNKGEWQTRVYFEESSKGVKEETDEIAGVETAQWVNWILERAESRSVPVPAPFKIETTAEPIPTEKTEIVTLSTPVTQYDAQLEILGVQVSEIGSSSGVSEKMLMAEARFKILGPGAETLVKKEIPFEILFFIVNHKSGAANLVALEQSQLKPQTHEYLGRQEFPISNLGRYELETIILLLPPGEMVVYHHGPTINVVPGSRSTDPVDAYLQ